MNLPTTYAEWRDLLDRIENSHADQALIETVRLGKALLNDAAANRFFRNACGMVERRVNRAQKTFQRQMDSAMDSAAAVSSAIKTLADEYRFVYIVVQNLPIKDANRAALLQAIADQADRTQTRLKEIAVRSRNEALVSLIYGSSLNSFHGHNTVHPGGM